MSVWYGRSHESRGTDRGAPEPTRRTRSCPGRAASRTTSSWSARTRRSRATRTSACTTWCCRTASRSTSTTRRSWSATSSSATSRTAARDAVFGLDVPLMRLMNVLKSAAQGYGTERRIILLHGPVGSAKSTIARQLKKGIEEYSRTADGALYTYYWTLPGALSELAGGSRGVPVADARRAAAPDPARLARADDQPAQARHRRLQGQGRGRRQPGVPADLQGADAALRAATSRR